MPAKRLESGGNSPGLKILEQLAQLSFENGVVNMPKNRRVFAINRVPKVKAHCATCAREMAVDPALAEMPQLIECDSCRDDRMAESPGYFCVTCGREWGISMRSNGQYYCSMCWTVWNS